MTRWAVLLVGGAVLAGGAGPGPLNITLPGSVKSVQNTVPPTGLPAVACAINGAVNAGGTALGLLGPAAVLYRRDLATGPVTLTLPPILYASLTSSNGGPAAQVTYGGVGTAQLVFKTATAGSVVFLPGGTTVPNAKIKPSFNNFTAAWNAAQNRLLVNFDLHLGNCGVPVLAAFQA